jgi:hypothetical protein
VMHRAALRADLPVPLHLRLSDGHHLAEHHRIPARTFPVPPMTSADRSLSPSSLPFFSGDASSSSGTATTIPPETGTACDGTR